MVNLLRKLFIKNYEDINDQEVRTSHGILASAVGVCSNLVLFIMKLLIGFFAGSIAIIGDSVNNLSDMGSSSITLFGFKMAKLPPDPHHPYGHERIEYISGLVVSIIILIIGFQLFIESIEQFFTGLTHYEPNNFTIVTFIILGISILIKLWQGFFNKRVGKIIKSVSLEATAQDSFNDCLSTGAILVTSLIGFIFPKITIGGYYISIDSLMGIVVAVIIFISGISMIKETIDPLIGVGPESDFVKGIVKDIKSYQGVLGVHDVICHMYGPTNSFVSVHVEVDANVNVMISHDLIDNIEHEVGLKHHTHLVIHMDPIDNTSKEVKFYRRAVIDIIKGISPLLSIHDFRIVSGESHTNLIFDCLVPFDFIYSNDEIKTKLDEELNKLDKKVFAVVNFDIDYANPYKKEKKQHEF